MNLQVALRVLACAAIWVASSTAGALTIDSSPATDVGVKDIFVQVSTKNELPNSNPGSEQSWIEGILGMAVNYIQHGNNVPITATNEDSTVYAWALVNATSDYFLVKNAAYWALYQNETDKAWAVVDADSGDLPEKMNFGNATISHYGLVAGDDDQVLPPSEIPMPAPLALIALGLIGLGWSRRPPA